MVRKKTKLKKSSYNIFFILASLLLLGVILLALNFVKLNNNSRAAQYKAPASLDDSTCQLNYPLYNQTVKPNYGPAADYCTLTICDSSRGYIVDNITTSCSTAGSCCRSIGRGRFDSNLFSIGDGYCRKVLKDQNATCVINDGISSCPKGTIDLNTTCRTYDSSTSLLGLSTGKCCGILNPTSTPTPTPYDRPGQQVRDCGPKHIDCFRTWTDGYRDTLNSRNTSRDGKTIFEPVCVGDNDTDINTFRCAMKVGTATKCDGYQYATYAYISTINGNRGGLDLNCYVSSNKTSMWDRKKVFKMCQFEVRTNSSGKNPTYTECKAISDKNK